MGSCEEILQRAPVRRSGWSRDFRRYCMEMRSFKRSYEEIL